MTVMICLLCEITDSGLASFFSFSLLGACPFPSVSVVFFWDLTWGVWAVCATKI
jgi:hypothetical protein